MVRAIILVVACFVLGGCASLMPLSSLLSSPNKTPPLQVHEQTSVELAKGNFLVVKTNVVGRSKGFSLLGIITMYPATLTKAMNRLYAEAQMQQGEPQTVAHLVIESSPYYEA